MLAISPMTSPAPLRRVNLPALLFPPSPPQSRTAVPGPSHFRSSSLVSQHPQLGDVGDSVSVASDSGDDVECLLSLQEAQVVAKGRLRSVICLWRDSQGESCGGILASVNQLEKHLARHVHAYADNLDQHEKFYIKKKKEGEDDDEEDEQEKKKRLLGIRCHWDRCSHHGLPNHDRLLEHVSVHVGKLVKDHCPHKNCIEKALSDATATHAVRAHPGLWTEDRLRPEVQPHPISPVQNLPHLPTQIIPYLLTCHAIRPKPKSSPTRSSRLRIAALRTRAQSESSSIADKVWPVMNERDPDDYWPMNGEAEPHGLGGNCSSSIFPPVVRETVVDTNDPIQRHRWVGREEPTALRVLKKPSLPRRPPLFTGADIESRAVKAELALRKQEEKAKTQAKIDHEGSKPDTPTLANDPTGKGKRKAADELPEEGRRQCSIDRITEASSKRARRVTGRTIGYEYFEEMVAFESRGIELGELPPDHSFRK